MRKNKIIYYYNKQLASFNLYFIKTLENKEVEDLHRLRVIIKKLRAIWTLMELVSEGKWKKKEHYALFKKLFKAGGRLREAQVNKEMISEFSDDYLYRYIESLHSAEKRYSKKLMLRMHDFDFDEFEVLNDELLKKMEKMEMDAILKRGINFVLKANRKIEILKLLLPNSQKLHQIRIELKSAQYIFAIINNIISNRSLKNMQGEIKSITRQLGLWHDYNVLLDSLIIFAENKPKKKKTVKSQRFIGRLEQKENEMQNSIQKELDNYLSRKIPKVIENNFNQISYNV